MNTIPSLLETLTNNKSLNPESTIKNHQQNLRHINENRIDPTKKDGEDNRIYKMDWVTSNNFTQWLQTHDCCLIASSYNSQQIYGIGVNPNNKNACSMWISTFMRPMGLTYDDSRLSISTFGRIINFVNVGETTNQFGKFNPSFVMSNVNFIGDADTHDLRIGDNSPYLILSKYNCIAQLSTTASFNVYWVPDWISVPDKDKPLSVKNLYFEDRCHLNGLCLLNGKPKYVSAAAQTDFLNAWKEGNNQSQGVIIDVTDNSIYCSNLWSPHSPKLYNGTLWLLESGTGYLGYVLDGKFIKKKFFPGFLRGLDFVDNYAVVSTSLDRHDTSFSNIPLSKELDAKKMPSKCCIWIVSMDTMNIEEYLEFTEGVTELYEVCAIKGKGLRPLINENPPEPSYFYDITK